MVAIDVPNPVLAHWVWHPSPSLQLRLGRTGAPELRIGKDGQSENTQRACRAAQSHKYHRHGRQLRSLETVAYIIGPGSRGDPKGSGAEAMAKTKGIYNNDKWLLCCEISDLVLFG